jgi:ectoine hydroxylase-related dioxygenase (phytanoyl-CoA dioxygenase family)
VADRKIVSLDNSASREEIQTLLERDGCLIINNAIGLDVIDALLGDLEPYLASKPTGNGNFTGFDTKRLHSLFQKSDRIGEFIVHDKLMEVMDAALKPFCDNYQLTSNSITAIGPGETVQPMHRDDLLYPIAHDGQRNLVCTSFWALSDFTADNGATRMVPGSHLWDDERKPGEEETVQAVMPKGSVCMFLGGIYHGGGANRTADQWRLGMFAGYVLGWLRQEQNYYMSVPPEMARKMPEKLARMVGYSVHRPYLGWVQDIQDPWDVINGYEELSKGGGAGMFADGEEKLVQKKAISRGTTQAKSTPALVRGSHGRSIQTVDAGTDEAELAGLLEEDGCLIIKDLISPACIDQLLDDLKPYLSQKPKGENDFIGLETKRLHSLFKKSSTIADFVANDRVLSMVDRVLGPYCDNYQLSSNSITAIGPSETPQPIHRGDSLYPLPHPSPRNLGCTAFWALTDFTAENGATRLVPGSHKWDDERLPEEAETVQAVMPKGSACLFVGGIYHAGSANRTEQWRIGMFAGYILGWLRQEQNFYLTVPPEEAKLMPEKIARLLGYSMHRPFLGWVQDLQDPWDVLQGYEDGSSGGSDLYAEGADDPVQGPAVAVL